MNKFSKLALAALALSLVPFELKPGKDGEFSYRSLLVGVSGRKDGEGKRNLTISLFNLPDCLKKKTAKPTAVAQEKEIAEPPAKTPAAEMPDTAPESPAEPTA